MHAPHPSRPDLPAMGLVFMALGAMSADASAHAGSTMHGFTDGLLHPLLGIDHLAAMLAVGLWSALAARRAGAGLPWGPLGFATLLLVGAMSGQQAQHIPVVEPMIAASLLVIGLLVVTRLRLPALLAASGMGAFALFHGLAHGHELAGGDSNTTWPALAGLLIATVLLHCAGLAAGWALRQRARWLARAAGAGVAALGGALWMQWVWS